MDGAIGAAATSFTESVQAGPPAAGILLAGRYRVLPDQRLNSLDSPKADAYAVIDEDGPSDDLFCLISPVHALARTSVARALEADPVEGMLTPLAVISCRWPRLDGIASAFVFRQPGDKRLGSGSLAGFPAAELARRVVGPATRVLTFLEAQEMTHRAIRADNLFWTEADEGEILFGECVSAAPGADQPALYETPGRMTAAPAGRGPGTIDDDLYAFGVTLVDLLYGLKGTDGYPPALLFQKLEEGTLASLVRQATVAPELAALLRGLLTDDPARRWTTRHLNRWLIGDRLEAPKPISPEVSQRPLVLGKGRFRTARSLAYGLWSTRDQSIPTLRDGTIERWLRTSLQDTQLAGKIVHEIKQSTRNPVGRKHARNILLQRCCSVLDPAGAIRFGSIALMPDAYGPMLASILLQEADTSEFKGLLESTASGDLLTVGASKPANHEIEKYVDLVRLSKSDELGGGIVRCLYDLNPDLPCLSPLASGVMHDLPTLLDAFERRAANMPEGGALLDMHAAAFIASKLGLSPRQVSGLAMYESKVAATARTQLRLLAMAQIHTGRTNLPGIARAVAVQLSPVIRSLRNRELRRSFAEALTGCIEKGDLPGIVDRMDNAALWQRDRSGFAAARRQFAAYGNELHRLGDPARSGLSEAWDEGGKLATHICLSISLAFFSLFLLLA